MKKPLAQFEIDYLFPQVDRIACPAALTVTAQGDVEISRKPIVVQQSFEQIWSKGRGIRDR